MKSPSRLALIVLGIFGVLAAALGGAAIYITTNPVDLSFFRNEIAAQLNAATGRNVKITGKIILGVSLTPTLEVAELQIPNMKWGRARDFVTIGQTSIRVRLAPLLKGRTEIISLSADHAVIHLETDGDKRRNWIILASAATPEGEEADIPVIEEIKLSEIVLDYRDIREQKPRYNIHLEDASLVHDSVNGIASYELTGKLDEYAVKASGKFAPLFTVNVEQPRQFDLKADVFGITLTANGSAKFPFKEFTYADFNVIAPFGLTQVAKYFGVKMPDLGAITVKGNVTPFGDVLRFGSMIAQAGKDDATGSVEINMKPPHPVAIDLRSKKFDFDHYLAVEAPAPDRPGKLFSTENLVFQIPDDLDVKIQYAVTELQALEQKIPNFVIDTRVANSAMQITQLNFDYAGGRLQTRLNITPRADDMAISISALAKQIDIPQLLAEYDLPKYAKGKGVAVFEGNAAGASIASLAADLDGRLFFEMQEGTIPKRLSVLLGGSITNVFRSLEGMFEGAGADAKIECGLIAFSIADGIAKTEALLLATDKAVMTGKGSINLVHETINMRLSPRPRDLSLINLASDVNVQGTLETPVVQLNKGSVAKKLGTTAFGLALGPLGLIIGQAGSAISRAGSTGGQCGTTRGIAVKSLQATGPWPELDQLSSPSGN